MPQGPRPPIKEPIKINLTGKERGFYSNMYSLAADGSENVSGKDAVTFFSKSGLPKAKMSEIWTIAARTTLSHVTREEFYLALRLIAYHQNGIEANEGSLKLNLEAPLPKFNLTDPSAAQPGVPQMPQGPAASAIAEKLPDLDDLDINDI